MATAQEYRATLEDGSDAANAFDAAKAEAKAVLAEKLKANSAKLESVMDMSVGALDSTAIVSIADEYIEKGTMTVTQRDGGTETFNKTTLIDRARIKLGDVNEFAKQFPQFASAMGMENLSADTLDGMLPDHQELLKPAARIGEAVEENTSFFDKIMFAIKGFINFVIDLFNGGESKGLMAHINDVAANTIADSASQKIAVDMQKNPNLYQAIDGQEGLDGIHDTVKKGVLAAREGKESTPVSIEEMIARVDATPVAALGTSPDKWTAETTSKVVDEQKEKISSLSQGVVKDFFDVNKNYDTLLEIHEEGLAKAGLLDKGLAALSPKSWEVSSTRNMLRGALNGKGGDGKVLIGDAIAEGAIQTFNDMDKAEIKGFITDPNAQASKVGKDVVDAAFETKQWKQLEANIQASDNLSDDQKTEFIGRMRTQISSEVTDMITANATEIQKAQMVEGPLLQVQERVQQLNTPKQGKPNIEDGAMLDALQKNADPSYIPNPEQIQHSQEFNHGNVPKLNGLVNGLA